MNKYQIQDVNGETVRYGADLYDSYEAAEMRIKQVEGYEPEANIDQFLDKAQISILAVIPDYKLQTVKNSAAEYAAEDARREGLDRIDEELADESTAENTAHACEMYPGSSKQIMDAYRKAYWAEIESMRAEFSSLRYTVHRVTDNNYSEYGSVIAASDDAAEAKALAKDHSGNYAGTVVVDNVAKTVDWGVQVTKIGEPCTWKHDED